MQIDEQNQHEQYYIKVEKILSLKITMVLIVLLTLSIIYLSIFLKQYDLLIAAFFPATIYYAFKSSVTRKNFMMNYAKENNLDFVYYSKDVDLPGRLFAMGNQNNKSTIYHSIQGQYNGHPLKIFDYNYSVGTGDHKTTYIFTVCELEITDLDFPYILLKSKSMKKHAGTDYYGLDKDTQIKLDSELEDKFNLYCRTDYEIEVLQIFDKDLLSYLIQHGDKFSIEFAKNKIYIYDDKIISKKGEMDELYSIMKAIVDKSGPLLKRLGDDFRSMHEFYNKK